MNGIITSNTRTAVKHNTDSPHHSYVTLLAMQSDQTATVQQTKQSAVQVIEINESVTSASHLCRPSLPHFQAARTTSVTKYVSR